MKFPSIHSQQVKVDRRTLFNAVGVWKRKPVGFIPLRKADDFTRKDMGFEHSGLWIITPIFFSGLGFWPLLRKSKRSAQGRPT